MSKKMSALPSRRKFIGAVSLAAASILVGNSLCSVSKSQPNANTIEMLWLDFCKLHDAQQYLSPLNCPKKIDACSGHTHQTGQLMHLPQEQLIIEPIWVFWGEEKHHPSDLLVNIYRQGSKTVTLNQYELQHIIQFNTLNNLTEDNKLMMVLNDRSNSRKPTIAKTKIVDNKAMLIA